MRYCPNCYLPEDLMSTCGRPAFGPEFQCPEPKEVDDAQAVRVECSACDKAFAFPASKVMKGSSSLATCQLGECAARFVFPAPEPAPQVSMEAQPLGAISTGPKARKPKATPPVPPQTAPESSPPQASSDDAPAPTTEEAPASTGSEDAPEGSA